MASVESEILSYNLPLLTFEIMNTKNSNSWRLLFSTQFGKSGKWVVSNQITAKHELSFNECGLLALEQV
ncbi:hypothetical protein JCGZ_26485 [Jatropha curcas]|uniref:Uncharacterized protein n=1 Tax=Jatropha curcas TaxID=180498 RepID=A0A067LFU1_JATCU|nr:hypothetical protein JCGZ_26485 [Jatropha curcas]